MRARANPFSALVLPLRLIGAAVFLYALVRMLATPDLTLIGIALIGSLLWQAGTAAQETSPLYRRLESTEVKTIMRMRPVRVRSSMSISHFRREHPHLRADAFIITTQDGYDAGVVMPEAIGHGSDGDWPVASVGEFARPISYVDALRLSDPILDAFVRFRDRDDAFLPVLDRRDSLAGFVTAPDLDRWVHSNHLPGIQRSTRETSGEIISRKGEEKLAA
jgi:hypothetical protein